MAETRLEAISQQVAPSSDDPPAITKVAGATAGPRAVGKVVIVTGANSHMGIGRATAYQFAENGAAAVYICDFDDSNLAAHARDITARFPGVDVQARKFDAADEDAVRGVVEDAITRFGRLDVFFANAGIVAPFGPFTETAAADFMNVMRVNALGPFLAAKHAGPAMQKTGGGGKTTSGGSIIMTASVAGLRSNAGPVPYSASKAAVVNMAQTIAFQLLGSGVRVNAVCPGLIETGMTKPLFDGARSHGTADKIGQLNPLGRAAHSDEVARAVLFLGSDDASYVNGQAWAIDGGLSAGHPFIVGHHIQ